MGGAFVSHDCGPGPSMKRPCSWQNYYDNRTQRRTGRSMIRGAHDYQRIDLDFGGSVGFVSDQVEKGPFPRQATALLPFSSGRKRPFPI